MGKRDNFKTPSSCFLLMHSEDETLSVTVKKSKRSSEYELLLARSYMQGGAKWWREVSLGVTRSKREILFLFRSLSLLLDDGYKKGPTIAWSQGAEAEGSASKSEV